MSYEQYIEQTGQIAGDCVDLNTLTDTFYIYPENCKFSVTKLALATEELWMHSKENKD